MKKLFSLLLLVAVIVVCAVVLPTEAKAATVASGTCGNNLTWVLDDQGTLTISGTGNMYGYDSSTIPWKSHRKSIKKIKIENGVTSIGNDAFYGCDKAESVSIPSTVQTLGKSCFSNCSSLRGIDIPYGVRMIPSFAFKDCSNAEYINVPSTVTTFGQSCFQDCSSITSFIIPEGTITIPSGMLWQCTSLRQVQIPKTVATIEGLAFQECGNLSDVYFTGTQAQYNAINIKSLSTYNQGLLNVTVHYSSKAPCISHTYGNWSKVNDTTHKHTCSICSKVEIANHTWNSGSVTKQATCKETGVKTYTCTGCQTIKTETIAKLTTHVYDNACDPTCNGCGQTRTVSHDYQSALSMDENSHWNECSRCHAKANVKAHTFPAQMSHDQNGHWVACTTCGTKKSYDTHEWEGPCDTMCDACEAVREGEHTSSHGWEQDATKHWQVCDMCGVNFKEETHTPGAKPTATTAQTCTVCGIELAPALGIQETEPTQSVTQPATQQPADAEKTTTTQKPAQNNEDDEDIPIWIPIVAVLAIGGIVVVVIALKKKY